MVVPYFILKESSYHEITSKEIFDRYAIEQTGQLTLFDDHFPDHILRKTAFQEVDPEFDKKTLIHWHLNIYKPNSYDEDETPYEIWKTWNNPIRKHFKYVEPSGYIRETGQEGIRLTTYKNEPTDKIVEELKIWLPEVKPFKFFETDRRYKSWASDKEREEEVKFIDLFEKSLSYNGIYFLIYFNDNKIWLCFTYSQPKKFNSLEECIDYVKERHYYQKNIDSLLDDDDDDDEDDY